jgi:YidC/Oxa1 family membrane protein insertase
MGLLVAFSGWFHPDYPILRRSDGRIQPFYLKRLLPFFMLIVRCKAFVMTLTELDLQHIRRSPYALHYVYVFHSLQSIHRAYQPGAFDHYDSLLCCGPHHVSEIRRDEELRGLAAKELVEAVYYRLERVHRAAQEQRPAPAGRTRGCVLIAPSWGPHNVLEAHGLALAETLLAAG